MSDWRCRRCRKPLLAKASLMFNLCKDCRDDAPIARVEPRKKKQQYRFITTWDEGGNHGYEWRWTVPADGTMGSYDEVAVITADDFWAGHNSFGYYMDTASQQIGEQPDG